MRSIALTAEKRDQVGSKSANALRLAGRIPCVVYGGKENICFFLEGKVANKIVFTPDFSRIDLSINGTTHPSIIKEIQFHKLNDTVTHIDFLELVEDKKVICEVPIKLVGVAKGVREGGRMLVKVRKLRLKCFPKHLVDTININIDTLELGKSVKVSDVKLEHVEILNSMNIPIASVEITRALKSAATEAAKADASKKK
jgi:large subunit ribosomal protein L25